jgi:hypothetical protein
MKTGNDILPELETDNFYVSHVGISFILKNELFKSGFKFVPSSTEDFEYLDLLRKNGKVIMISPYVKYFVNGPPIDNNNCETVYGKRIFVNYKEDFTAERRSQLTHDRFLESNTAYYSIGLIVGGIVMAVVYSVFWPFKKRRFQKKLSR